MNKTRYSYIPIRRDQQLVGCVVVLTGGLLKPSPSEFLEIEVKRFVRSNELKCLFKGTKLTPQGWYMFVEEHLDNPWLRILVWGIEKDELFTRCEIDDRLRYEEFVRNDNNLIIIKGGFGESNPKAYMDEVVMELVKNRGYNQFIEATLTNPYYRILLFNINDLEQIVF